MLMHCTKHSHSLSHRLRRTSFFWWHRISVPVLGRRPLLWITFPNENSLHFRLIKAKYCESSGRDFHFRNPWISSIGWWRISYILMQRVPFIFCRFVNVGDKFSRCEDIYRESYFIYINSKVFHQEKYFICTFFCSEWLIFPSQI